MMKRAAPFLAAIALVACSSLPSNVRLPVVVAEAEPYSENLAVASYTGDVRIEGTIGTDGRLYDARVVGNVPPQIEQVALDTAQRFVFKPGTVDGYPEEMELQFTVRFRRQAFR